MCIYDGIAIFEEEGQAASGIKHSMYGIRYVIERIIK